jgi:hypothetical protein
MNSGAESCHCRQGRWLFALAQCEDARTCCCRQDSSVALVTLCAAAVWRCSDSHLDALCLRPAHEDQLGNEQGTEGDSRALDGHLASHPPVGHAQDADLGEETRDDDASCAKHGETAQR